MKTKTSATRPRARLLVACVAALAALVFSDVASAVEPICTSRRDPQTASRLETDIRAALSTRRSTAAVGVRDPASGTSCLLAGDRAFDSASIVKVTILAALLRSAEEQGRALSPGERRLAAAMIERSDNDAASALWQQLGRVGLQHFLDLARLTSTILGPGRYWGLTQTTARDELRILELLVTPNSALTSRSRAFALALMRNVVLEQRWGVTAGVPADLTAAVKNGWLPRAVHGWRIHSIGAFLGQRRTYWIAVLTQDNPTMAYGVATVERIASVIHADLNPGAPQAIPEPRPLPSETPDEDITA